MHSNNQSRVYSTVCVHITLLTLSNIPVIHNDVYNNMVESVFINMLIIKCLFLMGNEIDILESWTWGHLLNKVINTKI